MTVAVSTMAEDTARELRRRLQDVLIVAALLAFITALHTFTAASTPTQLALHELYRRLYYLPVLYAASRFGLRGGIVTATAAALLFTPHAVLNLGGFFGGRIDNLFEIIMYVLLGGLFGRLRDLDDRRNRDLRQVSVRLEDAYRVLEDRAMQLITIQDYTQSILRSVASGVITVGPDGSVATVNPAAERILGMTEDVVTAKAARTLFRDDGGLSADLSRVLAGRVPRTMRDQVVTTRGGRALHVQVSVSRMRDVGGRRLGAVITIEDVSEIKALTDQLIRADRLAAMGELTAGVAHEVRNPLGIIRASVQLMEEGKPGQARVHEAAEVIKHEIDRLDRVIKALLDFGRPSAPTLRPVDVREVMEEVILFTRKFADRSNVQITEVHPDDLPLIMADPEQLKQVFVNLISNAVQAMADEGGTLTIETGHEDEFVFVRFADTGPGIPPEMLGKVFDPFFSTRDDGSGLGLTIVHRIVDEHGGHIEVASDSGNGTAFTIHLPTMAQEDLK